MSGQPQSNGAAPAPAAPAVPTPPPAAAPAAPAAPPASAAQVSLDALVPLTVNGRQEIVPLRTALADAQMHRAGANLLEQAKAERAEVKKLEQDAQNWRSLQGTLAADPDRAVEGITRLANLAKGVGVQAPARQQPNSRGLPPAQRADDGDVDPTTRDLTSRLASIEAKNAEGDLRREIDAVFERYPALKANDDIREMSEITLMAAKSAFPDAPLDRVAARLHTGLVASTSAQLTQERDQRLNNLNNPHVPASTGAAPLQQPPKITRESVRNGDFQKTMAAAFEMFKGRPGGGG